MARCATFPPPWLVLNGVSDEAVLQLIKARKCKPIVHKSSLTEELEQPVSDSLNDSSHNTQNIKGKEHGSIIQVDLRLKEHKYRQVLSSNELAPGPRKELWHFSSQKADLVADQNAEIASTSILTESCLLDAESQYKQLVWDWAAAPIQIEHPEFDDNFLGAMHLTYLMLAVIICGMEDVLYAINICGLTNISIPVSICNNNELL
ncbi:hypothetical protein WN944_028493 [Citrus x changshan-huyou]|uniref:Uncharacterized protein n=1 Tax=Citrus x changshan-huyou TaxID=2935761 RepID=A0AAP0LJY4_9ROSI